MEASTAEERLKAPPDAEAEAAAAAADQNGGAAHEPDLEGSGPDEQAVPALVIEGSGQLGLKIGGSKPDTSQVKLQGGSINLGSTHFEKGEYVNLVVKARVAAIEIVDKIDRSTGDVVETVRRHKLRVEYVEKVGG